MKSNPRPHHPGLRMSLGAIATTAALLASVAAAQPRPYALETAVREVAADQSGYGGLLALPLGGSRILRFAQPIGRVMVGNPKVGDVIPLSDRTLYVLAKAAGSTSLTVMPRSAGQPLATMDLRVGYDVDGFKRAAQEVMPSEPVEVSARGDGLVLTGLLSSSAAAARAAALAERFAPEHVVNLTRIRGAEQVMLTVHVSEVKRSALKQLGVSNIQALWDTEHLTTIPLGAFNPDAFASIIGRTTIGGDNFSIQAFVDLLEKKGFASTLAEPNLVALSGETAVFFAGGEFPIPVPQFNGVGSSQITIEYKQYGVSIAFTPTVYGDSINLLVAPEVSALDPQNSVVLNGFKIPGITTRRAKTTVDLRNGQSFAIAGLIRREYTNNMRGLPGVSNMPIFGQLFRSSGFQNDETEVVIIVTAHLAKPTTRENLLVPTDLRRGPTEGELFFTNATDVPLHPPAAPPPPRPAPQP